MRKKNEIKKFRRIYDFSQRKFASSIGISEIYLSRIELGWATPGKKLKEKIAKNFGVSSEIIFPDGEGHD